jgi:hypothetical protein
MADVAPVGTMLRKRNQTASAACPVCGHEETSKHLWTCVDEGMNDLYTRMVEPVYIWLRQGPEDVYVFADRILRYLRGASLEEGTDYYTYISDSLDCQQQLGIFAFLWGFHVKRLVEYVNNFFANQKRSGSKWLAILVTRLWSLYDELWMYRNKRMNEHERDTGTGEDASILDKEIEEMYHKRPNERLLKQAERNFFRVPMTIVKNKTRKQKRKWLRDANIILDRSYQKSGDPSAGKFIRFFHRTMCRQDNGSVTSQDMTKDGGGG